MKPVHIKSIPHEKQRYETQGDYFEKNGEIFIVVDEEKDPRFEFLCALHEFIESHLTMFKGIKWEDIDEYDQMLDGTYPSLQPGEQINAPYRHEHVLADAIERMVCEDLGITWEEYNR